MSKKIRSKKKLNRVMKIFDLAEIARLVRARIPMSENVQPVEAFTTYFSDKFFGVDLNKHYPNQITKIISFRYGSYSYDVVPGDLRVIYAVRNPDFWDSHEAEKLTKMLRGK